MRTRGFTLVEVLVALAVLAIALTAVMRIVGQSIDIAIAMRDRACALWVAENRLAMHLMRQDWPAIDTVDGSSDMGGKRWRWREQISGTPERDMRRIEITVRRSGKDPEILARLAGYARRPPGLPAGSP